MTGGQVVDYFAAATQAALAPRRVPCAVPRPVDASQRMVGPFDLAV
jgi:hypothetical protein